MKPRLFLLLLAVVFVLPLVVLGLYAAAPGWRYPDLVPAHFDGRALRHLVSPGQGPKILAQLAWSVLYSLLTVALSLALCLVPAQHFARCEFRGKRLLEALLLAPALVPSMTFSMGVHYAFLRLGLADTLAGVVLVLTTFSYPYMLRALVAGFQAYDPAYERCAANLGAGFLRRLGQVELPLLLPAVVAGGAVVFLVAFSEYFLVFLIGGGSVPSYTGYLFPVLNSSDRAMGSLLTLIFLAAPLLLFVVTDLAVLRLYRRKGMY